MALEMLNLDEGFVTSAPSVQKMIACGACFVMFWYLSRGAFPKNIGEQLPVK